MTKNLTIKILSTLLAITMLGALFSGCVKEDNENAETSGTQKADAEPVETEPSPADDYVEGGIDLTDYCIVRPYDASIELKATVTIFKNFLSTYCGVNVSIKTDDKAESEKEILFGLTNRAESISVYTDLDSNDWSVSLENNKIVLAAGSNRDIANTTNYLVENCLKKNCRYIVLGDTPISSDDLNNPNVLTLTLDGAKINQINVALLKNGNSYIDNLGFTEAALILADNIRMETMIIPRVCEYDPTSSITQILVTSVENGSEYLPAGVSVGDMQYALCKKENSVIIIAKDSMGAEMGAQAIISAMQELGIGKTLELSSLCKDSAVTYTYGSNLNLEKGAEYRIMTYNIERVELNSKDRSDLHLNNILFYNPDVVGFQEFCTDLKKTLGVKLKNNGYKLVEPTPEYYDSNDTSCASKYSMTNNYTPIAYKKDKFTLIECGAKRIIPSRTSGNSIQGSYGWPGYTVTWAVLKDNKTSEVFAVTALHNKTGSTTSDANKKIVSLGIVKGIVDNLVQKYSCPVFMGGDYNSKETMADYKSFVNATNKIYDSRYVAECGYAACGSHDKSGTVVLSGSTTSVIDHIFVTGNARVLRHRFGHALSVAQAADHKPVFIDVSVGESSPSNSDKTRLFSEFSSMYINTNLGNVQRVEKVENIAIKKMSE